jgi:hypothetical protein
MTQLSFAHERLDVYRLAIDDGGKSDLKRIVSMRTRLIQRQKTVAADAIEYEYRDAEYEYEEHRGGEA